MKKILIPTILVLSATLSAQSGNWLDAYREPARRLVEASQASDFAWQRLAEVTDLYGNRLSGSVALERAIQRLARTMAFVRA